MSRLPLLESESLMDRRGFLGSTTLAAAAVIAPRAFAQDAPPSVSPSDQIQAAVIGLGRGMAHAAALWNTPKARITYLCDVDQKRLTAGMKTVEVKHSEKNLPLPTPIGDLRRALDDPKLEAVFIATSNHWHAPATILACAAGKHVYVEKPGSHNGWEGEQMVLAARKHRRVVQMGNQRRSWPALIEAMQKLKAGAIGNVLYARCWYDNQRPSIGIGKPAPVPEHLDYALWQGPAPERPYKDNLVHYNWHWHWHYGGGEMANNGIHALDVARWGLGVDTPSTVSYVGGRYHFRDDQETPDTGTAVFHFPDGKGCSFEGSSCHPRRDEKHPFVAFFGSEGSLRIDGSNYTILNLKGEKTDEGKGPGGEQQHIENFLDCIRSGQTPNSEIEIGQTSTRLCHWANLSYRTGRTLHLDPATRQILSDSDASQLWKREYRNGWEPQV